MKSATRIFNNWVLKNKDDGAYASTAKKLNDEEDVAKLIRGGLSELSR